jgi:DNA-binding CsgD family transcriptional regulator
MPSPGLSDLVARAYEAACDTAGMSGFIERTAVYFGAQQAAIAICPHAEPDAFLPITHGITPDEITALFARREQAGTLFERLQHAVTGETFSTSNYQRPPDLPIAPPRRSTDVKLESVNVMAGVVVSDDHNRCDMMLFRDRARGDFSPPEHEALQSLMGYLRRAIDLNRRHIRTFVEHRTALSVLENAPRSIMILGQAGQVTYRNHAAHELLRRNDGLGLQDGLFTVADPGARADVEAFLETARTTDEPEFDRRRLMIVVPRLAGGTPFKLVMYKLPFDRRQPVLDDRESLAVALVYDPATMNQLNENLLQNFYRLTHAETALAQALYDGRTLPEASAQLGISVNTTRTQLRSIFRKVGVHSQAALLQELAKSFIHA